MGTDRAADTFQDVLTAERIELQERREAAGLTGDRPSDGPLRTTGLALSGGGTRSACVGLGILQALYRAGLLRQIDYLSTVSGGGYVGSYLSSWLSATKGKVDWRSEKERDAAVRSAGAKPSPDPAPVPLGEDGKLLPFYARREAPQPPPVCRLANMGETLRQTFKFLSCHLWGVIIVNGFVLSVVVFLGALAALAMRTVDLEPVSRFLQQLGFHNDIRRAFFPATVAFGVWLLVFFISNRFRGHRLKTLTYILFLLTMVLGFVSLLSVSNVDTDSLQVQQGVGTGAGDFIRKVFGWMGKGLFVAVAAAITPYISLRSLIRSGTAPRWKLESWFFNLATYALLAGVPLVVFAWVAQENISNWNEFRPDAGKIARAHIREWRDWARFFSGESDPAKRSTEAAAAAAPPASSVPSGETSRWGATVTPALERVRNGLASLAGVADSRRTASPGTAPLSERASPPPGLLAEAIRQWLADTQLRGSRQADKRGARDVPGRPQPLPQKPPLEEILHLQLQIDDRILSDWLPQYWLAALTGSERYQDGYRDKCRLDSWKDQIADTFNDEVLSDPFLVRYVPGMKTESSPASSGRGPKRPSDLAELDMYRKQSERLLTSADATLRRYRARAQDVGFASEVPPLSNLSWSPGNNSQAIHERWNVLLLLEREAQTRFEDERRNFDQRDLDDNINDVERLTAATEALNEVRQLLLDVRQNNWNLVRAYGFDVFQRDLLYPSSEVFSIVVAGADQWYRLRVLGWSAVAVLVFGTLFNVNTTLLHSYYRDQLAEQWIAPHPKYGLRVPLKDLENCRKGGPLHLLTGTLTLFGKLRDPRHDATGRFTFSPTHVGSTRTGFAPTEGYARGECELADAMAISGAAVSLTALDSVLIRVLLLLANFRLGQWMPNPSNPPGILAWPTALGLLAEYLFQRPEDRSYLFIADGGYVDNTGITPLLQRRCRVIIACDAGQDAAFEFADLRRAMSEGESRYGVRLSATDAADPIPFETLTMPLPEHPRPAGTDPSKPVRRLWSKNYYLVIRIEYPDDETTRQARLGDNRTGYLIYVKPTLTGREPADLLRYRDSQPAFPHDPTVEQFFDPEQFQMYRRLGERLGDVVARECFPDVTTETPLWNWKPNGEQRERQQLQEGLGSLDPETRIAACRAFVERMENDRPSEETCKILLEILRSAFDCEGSDEARFEICRAAAILGMSAPEAVEFVRSVAADTRFSERFREQCRDLLKGLSPRPKRKGGGQAADPPRK